MVADVIGLYRIRLTAGTLVLRLVQPDELPVLAAAARQPLYADKAPPSNGESGGAWVEAGPDRRARATVQGDMASVGDWRPDRWCCPFGVWRGAELLGVQSLNAVGFARDREVWTGSWLALAHQGEGVGTVMRAAVLAFAFTQLGARSASSRANTSAVASARVSAKLGYHHVGDSTETDAAGRSRYLREYAITAEQWRARPRPPVSVTGFDPAAATWFGSAHT